MQNAQITLANGVQIKVESLSVAEALELAQPAKVVPQVSMADLSRAAGKLAEYDKILAIKLVRGVTGWNLRESKDYVDGAQMIERREQERRREQDATWKAQDDERARANGEIPF